MKLLRLLPLILLLGLAVASCKKDKSEPGAANPSNPTPYYVKMTDAPGPYTAVNIDIQGVEITGNGNTVMLSTKAGIYNLLDLANGKDTLIANGLLTVNKVQQIRFILGPNNSVVVGGVSYSLSTPSAQQSGLKLQVHQDLQAGVAYEVLVDFDAGQSIVFDGNGGYSLKPVIRTIEHAVSGSLTGKINKTGIVASVTASSDSTHTYSSITDLSGQFLLAGLPAGAYTVIISPPSPYNSVTLNNVMITTGVMTNIGVQNVE